MKYFSLPVRSMVEISLATRSTSSTGCTTALLVASEIDGGDFSRLKARTRRQHASHIQIKVRGCIRGRIYVGDQAVRVEPVLREDSHRVRKESRRRAVQCPGDFHDGRRSQIADGLAAFPFGLTIHVHRELVAVRPLNDEGLTWRSHSPHRR